jgi:hypothetical protein
MEFATKQLAYSANGTQLVIDAFAETSKLTVDAILGLTEQGLLQTVQNSLNGWGNKVLNILQETYTIAYTDGNMEFTLQEDAYDINQEYTWELGGSVKHCPDCLARAGMKMTYAEWVEIGTPRTGCTVCGGYCQCELVK